MNPRPPDSTRPCTHLRNMTVFRAFIADELARRRPALACARSVAAHLGAGASICALEGGFSCDTTMGFSTLDGVPMATRCGATDPGVLLHLMRARDMSADADRTSVV